MGIAIRFSDAAITSSDHGVAMLRTTASASSDVRQPLSPDFGFTHPQLRMLAAPPMDRQNESHPGLMPPAEQLLGPWAVPARHFRFAPSPHSSSAAGPRAGDHFDAGGSLVRQHARAEFIYTARAD